MRARLLLLSAVVVGGCASQTEWYGLQWKTPSGSDVPELSERLAAVQGVQIPVPEKTPYDYDADARRSYLGAYEAGYRYGLAGLHVCILFASDPLSRAADAGWRDGQSVGSERHSADLERELKALREDIGPFHEEKTVEASDEMDAARPLRRREAEEDDIW